MLSFLSCHGIPSLSGRHRLWDPIPYLTLYFVVISRIYKYCEIADVVHRRGLVALLLQPRDCHNITKIL